ncbi:hypothetical protein Leryth_016510 [Lithospermum erythrorhizon]|nr:hypothetical protein Leryth_016510 [Lithospermum erythrorhizon]
MAALLEEKQNHPQPNGGAAVATKRQRRPSVRLADPGGGDLVYYDPFLPRQQRRSTKKRRQQPPPPKETQKVSKETLSDVNNDENRSIVNNKSRKKLKDLKKRSGVDENVEESEGDLDAVAIGMWKTRVSVSKNGKKISNGDRLNLGSKVVDENPDEGGNGEADRNFEPIRSEEEEEQGVENHDDSSPVRSIDKDDSDNNDDDDDDVNENGNGERDDGNGVEKGRSGKDLRFRVSDEMDDLSDLSGKEGVKVWLRKLGLQRYGPVFEIHEVDDEVLPLLTLEDLKDMGITAVGSRRKMFCSIQNLDKGFC